MWRALTTGWKRSGEIFARIRDLGPVWQLNKHSPITSRILRGTRTAGHAAIAIRLFIYQQALGVQEDLG